MSARAKLSLLLLIATAAGVMVALWPKQKEQTKRSLTVFCAAGLKKPVEAAAKLFEQEMGTTVALQFGGTGTLLSQMAVAKTGDVFIAADAGSVNDAKQKKLIRESLPIVKQTPVIAVKAGNPLGIHKLDDLLRADVKVALANPEAASIGRSVKSAMGEGWTKLADKATVMKPTVTEIAADLSLGAVDAAVIWDALLGQFKGLEAVHVPEFDTKAENASACIMESCQQPQLALQFARFLAAPERGGKEFTAMGYTMLAGDVWKPKQEILIYSGAVNRPALEPLLKAFSDREGVVINTVYNGCGVLCASLKTIAERGGNQLPDAYFACDLCFVPPVAEMFPQVNVLTETKIVIAVLKGNPKGIKGLSDLAQPGIKLGLCNQQQSTLGFMTSGLLKTSGLETAIRKNLAVEVPTADFLINQLRAGGLDAAIVYLVNVLPQQEHLESIELPMAEARAAQPFAVRHGSEQAQTASRLLTFLQGHQKDFEQAGFVWRGNESALESKNIAIPDWLKK